MRLQGGVVGAIDGEKDPRNLMYCFQLVVLLVARAPYPALPHAIPGSASRHTGTASRHTRPTTHELWSKMG